MRIMAILGLTVLWLLLVVNILWPFAAPWGEYGNMLFTALIVIHVIEFVLFRVKIRNSGDKMSTAMMMTMLYGFFYLQTLPKSHSRDR